MAFTPNASASSSNATARADWQAQAFLNFYIRKGDGSRMKVGAIPLKQTKKVEAQLIERLKQDGALDSMMEVLEVDFHLVDDGKPVDLGF